MDILVLEVHRFFLKSEGLLFVYFSGTCWKSSNMVMPLCFHLPVLSYTRVGSYMDYIHFVISLWCF